jgi:group I intron endonuclease
MNNIVYLTTNLISGKQYVGDHILINEDDGYLGSGILINKAINKYGKLNFAREILEKFETKEEAFNAQERYIQQYNTLTPNGYNISPKGGLGVVGCHSSKTKQQISDTCSISLKGRIMSESHRKKLSDSAKIHNKGENNPMFGKKQSEESNNKNRQSNLGKSHKKYTLSEETKEKMRKAKKGVIPWNKKQK